MKTQHHFAAALAAGCTALLTGCGITDPYSRTATTRPAQAASVAVATATTNADPAPERNGRILSSEASAQQSPTTEASPRAALTRYAATYINWTATTVASNQRQLAALSVDQARAQALQAAATYSRDTTLQLSRVRNRGRLVSISPSLITPGLWVIVTSEQTTGQGGYSGLPPTLHITYAQTTQTATGFAISLWAPQN